MSQRGCYIKILGIALALSAALLAPPADNAARAAQAPGNPAAPPPSVQVKLAGEPEVVYRWAAHACKEDDWPDAAARAFKDASGQVRLIATGYHNWSMVGPNLNSLRADCHSLMVGGNQADPGAWDDLPWIEATYTLDGKHVVALMSNEWNAWRHRETALARESECDDPHHQHCYFYSITQANSDDGGAQFAYPPGRHMAAALPERFHRQHGSTDSQGYAEVSNIFARDGHFFAFLGVRASGVQPGGNCLIRTDTPLDPGSWRGWDGQGFSVRFADPYHEAVGQPAQHVCVTIPVPGDRSAEVRSVSWHAPSHSFIAVVRGVLKPVGAEKPLAGFFYSTSPDLIHWSGAGLIMPLALHSECKPTLFYPSLLDPASPGRNFEAVGDSPYIYFTRFNVGPPTCKGGLDRDLVRVRLQILPAG